MEHDSHESIDFPKGRRLFYLLQLVEPKDHLLFAQIVEASSEGVERSLPGTNMVGREIISATDARPLELVWDSPIAYCVRDELFVRAEDELPNDMLIVLTQSAFLDFIAKTTLATAEHPGPLKHWQLTCLNHVIDVVATRDPVIRVSQHLI